jgi:signal transduction histidine kinase
LSAGVKLTQLCNLFRRLIPRSIFGRVFLGIFAVSVLALLFVWGWFYHRFFTTLNIEAGNRLKKMAQTLAAGLDSGDSRLIDASQERLRLVESLWLYEKNADWVRNLYWLDVSGPDPVFIASFSSASPQNSPLLPPTAIEVEDMVFAYINELEKGQAVMPDPFSAGVSRRFKIVLFPILDSDQMLESVIGIEADMKYLQLLSQLKRFFFELILISLLLSIFTAYAIARNLSSKISLVVQSLKETENNKIPASQDLHIDELNRLHEGLTSLAQEIRRKDQHLKEVFARKLEELSFIGASIAHEIRNPLSAAEMHFSLLKRELEKAKLLQNPSVGEIEEQIKHLRTLVENFLRFSRKVEPVPEKINLKQFIQEMAENRQAVYENFFCEIDISDSLVAFFDKTMLKQICENLLNNAVEACENQRPALKISATENDNILILTFANDGPPVSDEVLPKLFTPFVSSKADGHGIGLALVRKLVEAHGGEISCENTGEGVIFRIEVPIV